MNQQKAVAVILCVGLMLSGLGGSAVAGRKHTVLACAVGYYNAWEFRNHPSRCTEYRGSSRAHVFEIKLKGLRWRNWAGRRTFGRGRWIYVNMGIRVTGPARLKASRRVRACGRRVYTRLRVRLGRTGLYRNKTTTYRLRLPRC